MRRNTGVFLIFALLLLAVGCRDNKPSDRVAVAECYGVKLYADELNGLVPEGASKTDSISLINSYIDTWIHRQVLLHQAENNLTAEERDFSRQLQDYQNSLLIYAYETHVIDQYLDTVVGEDEIAAYYEENKENFQLRSTMVKAAFVVLDEDCQQRQELQHLMSAKDTLLISQVDSLADQSAVLSFLDVDSWIRLDDLLLRVPVEIYNVESFLKKNRFVTFEKEDLVYMVRFEDYLLEESVSPIEIESDNIKHIILQKRKKELLSRINAQLYEKAVKEQAFKIY